MDHAAAAAVLVEQAVEDMHIWLSHVCSDLLLLCIDYILDIFRCVSHKIRYALLAYQSPMKVHSKNNCLDVYGMSLAIKVTIKLIKMKANRTKQTRNKWLTL